MYLYNHLIDLFKILKNEVEYIYKLKYEFLEIIIKWLLRYYTAIFTIFGGNRAGRFGGVDGLLIKHIIVFINAKLFTLILIKAVILT